MHQSQTIDGTYRPVQDYVLLRPIKEPEKMEGGLFRPDNARKYGACEVMCVGPGRLTSLGVLIACELKVGEFVYIQKFVEGELKFKLNGEDVYAIRERHVNCVLDGYEPPKAPRKSKTKK